MSLRRIRLPSLLWRALSLLALTLLCSACTSSGAMQEGASLPKDETVEIEQAPKPVAPAPTPPAPSPVQEKAQQELAKGISSYENGAYARSASQMRNALTLGLETRKDEAKAHKYLAFMHCVGKRERLCRDEFRKALEADPTFNLTTAEAGHPTWGPVFRKVKNAGKPAAGQ